MSKKHQEDHSNMRIILKIQYMVVYGNVISTEFNTLFDIYCSM